ncbi:GAF domain-containing protein [Novosphingobium sp. 9U]|uniref:GAF domain-containing protein n=1 Tax=Novosphingobium sp. 9U TaxID=2653158 RepID=UPI0012EF5951|nr:GAF domain-containing protein [Novosphingobium sp. 9U]VWX52760.1 putative Histidine kinase [Novosphingobium sp. 9U]
MTDQAQWAAILEGQPASARLLVGVIRAAPVPMFVLLGEDRRLIYNDTYIPILGPHHPKAMGRPFFEVWPEVEKAIGPVIDRAFAGKSSLYEDLPVVLHRPEPRTAWFTFSYSPVRDEDGAVFAALCVCSETTDAVAARARQEFLMRLEAAFRDLAEAEEIVSAAQAALGTHFGVSRVGYGSLDLSERYFTTQGNWTDGSVPNFNGTHDLAAFGPEIFGTLRAGITLSVDDTLADDRAASEQARAAFAALEVRSAATVSLVKGGRLVAVLYLHDRSPRRWTKADIALIEEVAERTWSAVERAHAQADLRALARRQAFLLRMGDEVRLLSDPGAIQETAARLLGEELHVGRVGYGEIDEAVEHVTVERDWHDGTMGSLAGETRPLAIFGPAIIDALKAGEILRLPSIEADPLSAPYSAGYDSIGTKALLVVPLIKHGKLTAILYLHEGEPRAWSELEGQIALEVAERTWAAVERARAEDAVRHLNATLEQRVDEVLAERKLFADIVADTDAPIQMVDTELRFLAINAAAQEDYENIFGARPQVGDGLPNFISSVPEERAAALGVWHRALSGESFEQLAWWGEGASAQLYEMRFRPVRDGEGEVTAAYLIGRDITELHREQERLAAAEDQLRQSQKMEAIGQLTGGVAHDFNNLLTPIIGSLDMLQRKQLGGEREQRLIAGASQSAERAKVLVQRLLAFARRQPLQTTAVDLAELVRGMADLIASTAGPQIKVAVEIAADLARARADGNQLEMALLNLAVNARDAMPDGGTLRISAEPAPAAAVRALGLPAGDYLRLSVADTGEGMDEATAARAIEPFFSTKGLGKGTGLGLSMVHGLALQLGGAMTIESRPGLGTNVRLWLPVCVDEDASDGTAQALAAGPAGSGTALLVDDEELVRMSTAEMLADLGYAVTEASSGEEALQRVREGLRPRVLVTDHLMPGMSGTQLARDVLAAAPDTRVLVVSGYAALEDIAPDLPRLAKPFRSEDLAAALDGAMASAQMLN